MRIKTAAKLTLGALALTTLAGCGVRGSLERPAPIWGEERERYEQEQERAAAAKKEVEEAIKPDDPVAVERETPAPPPPPSNPPKIP